MGHGCEKLCILIDHAYQLRLLRLIPLMCSVTAHARAEYKVKGHQVMNCSCYGVSVKAGLWTLDWTVDWTVD